jgi:hypothetical protein
MRSGIVQAAASAQVTSITHHPSGMLRPVSSAIGMNSAGESGPRLGRVHRSNASNAMRQRIDLEAIYVRAVLQVEPLRHGGRQALEAPESCPTHA